MSYCRWSSDNWRCDLYVYEYCYGGYMCHVAGNRHVGEIPKQTPWSEGPEKFFESHKAQLAWLDTCEREDIGGKHDGESFNVPTLEELRDLLLMLRGEGYRFPDYVLEAVEQEMREVVL